MPRGPKKPPRHQSQPALPVLHTWKLARGCHYARGPFGHHQSRLSPAGSRHGPCPLRGHSALTPEAGQGGHVRPLHSQVPGRDGRRHGGQRPGDHRALWRGGRRRPRCPLPDSPVPSCSHPACTQGPYGAREAALAMARLLSPRNRPLRGPTSGLGPVGPAPPARLLRDVSPYLGAPHTAPTKARGGGQASRASPEARLRAVLPCAGLSLSPHKPHCGAVPAHAT